MSDKLSKDVKWKISVVLTLVGRCISLLAILVPQKPGVAIRGGSNFQNQTVSQNSNIVVANGESAIAVGANGSLIINKNTGRRPARAD